ncbi:MAG: hypothetical protein JNM55_10345 [Anaerolineales bacterium]|nr:hypothetical protein [Anaerolineales bacterium]
MATIHDLSNTLNHWTRRLRIQRAFKWFLRGLILGLALAFIVGVYGLFQLILLRNEFLAVTLALTLIIPIIISLIAYLWPVQPIHAARHFDRVFHLGERMSTAFELHQTHSSNPLATRQLEDAVNIARKIKPSRDIPLQWKKSELAYALGIALLIGLVWFRGEQWFESARQARAVEQAIAKEAAQIEETIQQIQANDALTEEQKQELNQLLEQTQQSLQENPSLEGSVSALTTTSEKLESMSSAQTEQMSQALQQTGSELAKQEGGPLQGVGEALAQGNIVNAASELANINVSELNASEANQLANQLDAMADSLQSTNPQLAQELQTAADALRRGDMTAAQQALQDASQSMAQAGQQVAMSQTASQTAQQFNQGAGQIMAAGGSGQSQQAQNDQGQGQQANGQGSQNGQSGQNPGGTGSGNGSGDAQNQTGPEAGSNPINQNNGPGDGGQESYEQIYAPSLLGGDGNTTVNLPGSGQDGDVIGQGPTDPSQPGQSLVPYTEVYSQYDQFNRQAIENGDIPVDFMSIIRNYFDSLQP